PFQGAGFVEEALDHVEPAHSGRSLEVQSRAATSEKLGGLRAIVVQRRKQRVPSGRDAVDRSAVLQQSFEKLDLDSGSFGVNARGDQPERRAASHWAFWHCVDLTAGVEEDPGYFDSVLWALLAVSLKAVRADIMKQRNAVLAR